jgi:hypothetical protein
MFDFDEGSMIVTLIASANNQQQRLHPKSG